MISSNVDNRLTVDNEANTLESLVNKDVIVVRYDSSKDDLVVTKDSFSQRTDLQEFWGKVRNFISGDDPRIDLLACSLVSNSEGIDLTKAIETALDVMLQHRMI